MIVTCPACGQAATLPDDSAGRRFACPHCRAVLPEPVAPTPPGGTAQSLVPQLTAGLYASPPVHRHRIRAPGAVLSLVLGIIAILTPWSFCVAMVLAILAILQGGSALDAIRRRPEKYTGRGMALAGRILGIAALAIQGPVLLLLPTLS